METIDGNKLIADFEKLETPDGIYYEYLTKDGNRSKLTHFMLLEYHTDWNWLMSVVGKISRDERFIENEYREYLLDVVPYGRIEEVFEAVVEFIKKYNEEKN
jgi:hypothetical protein